MSYVSTLNQLLLQLFISISYKLRLKDFCSWKQTFFRIISKLCPSLLYIYIYISVALQGDILAQFVVIHGYLYHLHIFRSKNFEKNLQQWGQWSGKTDFGAREKPLGHVEVMQEAKLKEKIEEKNHKNGSQKEAGTLVRKLRWTKKMVKDRPSLKMQSNSRGEPSPTKDMPDSRETVRKRRNEAVAWEDSVHWSLTTEWEVCWQTSSLHQH